LLKEKHAVLIDVRSPEEFAEQHAKGAINIPLGELNDEADLPDDREAPLITICAVGQRSLIALLVLKSIGYRNVKNVAGGLNAWVAGGLPT